MSFVAFCTPGSKVYRCDFDCCGAVWFTRRIRILRRCRAGKEIVFQRYSAPTRACHGEGPHLCALCPLLDAVISFRWHAALRTQFWEIHCLLSLLPISRSPTVITYSGQPSLTLLTYEVSLTWKALQWHNKTITSPCGHREGNRITYLPICHVRDLSHWVAVERAAYQHSARFLMCMPTGVGASWDDQTF